MKIFSSPLLYAYGKLKNTEVSNKRGVLGGVKNWSNLPTERGRGQKYRKCADIFNGWSPYVLYVILIPSKISSIYSLIFFCLFKKA